MIRLYRTSTGVTAVRGSQAYHSSSFSFDDLFRQSDPRAWLENMLGAGQPAAPDDSLADGPLLAPVESQEIWAAGVTYTRSREARMEESEKSGGASFYDKVYEAPRPELFFKATAARARGHKAEVCIRSDSFWDVPEPELTLAINAEGKVFGYTVGNDMSSRDIEGQNPLYLPQAKVYRGSCALGPALCIADPPAPETSISLEIERDREIAFLESTAIGRLKRTFDELADWLFRENEFPAGAYLMTGTGIVPPAGFSLMSGDIVRITCGDFGTLENSVE